MLEDHRGGPRHDSLLSAYPSDDGNSGWMISYIDIMTLLVALFVIIIAAANVSPGWSNDDPLDLSTSDAPDTQQPELRVPLPETLERTPAPAAWGLSPAAISASLGVVGPLPRRPIASPAQVPVEALPPPALLARLAPGAQVDALDIDEPAAVFEWLLPTPLFTAQATARQGNATRLAGNSALADYMVILTDQPPVNAIALSDEAIEGAVSAAEGLNERVADSLYLPSLEGVEVARVAEGISLRVQDQLLFPSATSELTESGASLVDSLLETIQRFDGEVWVEGHSDSQSINTPEFSSNWALSSARAIAIVEALEAAGVEASRLRAVGLAATRPLEDNTTADGRARNRRVEVVIHVE
ncbi:OmpA family protein [Vreelandella sp. EE7]